MRLTGAPRAHARGVTDGRIGSGDWLGLLGSGVSGLALLNKGDPKDLDILRQYFDLTSELG
jgi:hypothetical protein